MQTEVRIVYMSHSGTYLTPMFVLLFCFYFLCVKQTARLLHLLLR